MTLLFLSNFFNHHQSSISQELYQQTNGQYRFVATEAMPDERKKLGYANIRDDFVFQYGEDPIQDQQIQQWVDEADVVIIGSAPEQLIRNRKKQRKLIFRYSERPLKNGCQPWKYPLRWIKWNKKNPSKASIYLLCASGFTASDYRMFGLFQNKSYKWGYFPECIEYDNFDKILESKKTNEILWCGRFLDWKHPDDAITVAKKLKSEGYAFNIKIIGTGDMSGKLHSMVESQKLADCVEFCGSMSPQNVRTHMERAGIFLFTSDNKEGWGAVLNEAMNSGCAVVASHAIGAVPFLITNQKNGIVYESSNTDMLYEKVKYLLDNPDKQRRLGENAYRTIAGLWNAKVAAARFLVFTEEIMKKGCCDLFEDGPCSRAPVLKNNWFKEEDYDFSWIQNQMG